MKSLLPIAALAFTAFLSVPQFHAADDPIIKDGEIQQAPAEITGVIITFNGALVNGVPADTRNKDFRPVFEKELARLAGELPGKPALTIKFWYSALNGAAIQCPDKPAGLAKKLVELLAKKPYVKTAEQDGPVSIKQN